MSTFQLDPDDTAPLYAQLAAQLRAAIVSGTIAPGEALPSTRALAADLDINFHTARRAYHELSKDALIEAPRGGRYRVIAQHSHETATDILREDARRLARRAITLGLSPLEALGIFSEEMTQAARLNAPR
ncbi:MAG: GntR family transcriptional regulator [Myxococcota bacterium]